MSKALEALSPAGSLAHVDAALDAGADAVYLGIRGISARPDAWSFDLDTAAEAVRRVHSHGKRVYLALNAECHESKWAMVEDAVSRVAEVGCDALIIGDWGLLRLLKRVQPGISLHASTLLGIYNAPTLALAREMGIVRVIFNTNLYLDEVAALIHSDACMEFEIIACGGVCLNDCRRCRLPHWREGERYFVGCRPVFDLEEDGTQRPTAHQLNSGDVNLASTLALYVALGISSFKIEGRTRDVEYVRKGTACLRAALDQLESTTPQKLLHYIDREVGAWPISSG